jgi:hypothetical protein
MKKYKYEIKKAKFDEKRNRVICQLSFEVQDKTQFKQLKSFIASTFINQIKRCKPHFCNAKKAKLLTMRFSEEMHQFIVSLKKASGLHYNDVFETLMCKSKIIINSPDPSLSDLEHQRLAAINNLRSEVSTTFKNLNQIAKHLNTLAIEGYNGIDINEINASLLSIDCALNRIGVVCDS